MFLVYTHVLVNNLRGEKDCVKLLSWVCIFLRLAHFRANTHYSAKLVRSRQESCLTRQNSIRERKLKIVFKGCKAERQADKKIRRIWSWRLMESKRSHCEKYTGHLKFKTKTNQRKAEFSLKNNASFGSKSVHVKREKKAYKRYQQREEPSMCRSRWNKDGWSALKRRIARNRCPAERIRRNY